MTWLLRCRRPRWLKRIYLSCLTALALFSAQLPAQLTPATNQQQDPVVTDVPSHARGVPSNQTESFTNLNNLLHLFSLYRAPRQDRGKRVFHILLGDQDNPDPRLLPIVFSGVDGNPNICDGRHALLLHLAVWHIEPAAISDGKTPRTFALAQSEWHGFLLKPKGGKPEPTDDLSDQWPCKLVESEREDGTPSFYHGTDIYFVGVNAFDSLLYGSRVSVDYKLDTIGLVPQNILDLAAGISAVSGVTSTPTTPATTQLTPPSTIDTGDDNRLPLGLVTVLTNVYQGRVNEMPASSPIVPTAPRPYSLNNTFFLQFLPSLLTLSQGQILQDPSSPIQTSTENKAPTDTRVHLKERLETIAKGYDVTALGPLPPVLNFTQDLAEEEHALSATISQDQQIPAVTAADDVAHIDAILAQDYEAITVIETSESASIVQATSGLSKFLKTERNVNAKHQKQPFKSYYRGDPNLPDGLASNFTSSIESVRKDIQSEIDHYRKVISPAYQGLLSLLQQDTSTVTSARDALRSAAGLPSETGINPPCTDGGLQSAMTKAPATPQDYASNLDCILSEKSILNHAVTHFNEHLSALGLLCRNSQNTSKDACTKQASEPYPSCDVYTKTDDPTREAGEVAACKKVIDDALSDLNKAMKEFATPATNDSSNSKVQDAIKSAQLALSTPRDVLANVQICNSLMAQARLDQNAADILLEDQKMAFSDFYKSLFDNLGNQTKKANTETSKTPETIDPKNVPGLQETQRLFAASSAKLNGNDASPTALRGSFEWSDAILRRIDHLALAATSARQQIDEVEFSIASKEPQQPSTSSADTSAGGGCCCCCAASASCANNNSVQPGKLADKPSALLPQQTPVGNQENQRQDPLLSAAGVADAAQTAETATVFLTSPKTGGVISGIPFRSGDFPLVMVLAGSTSENSNTPPACALSGQIEDDREACQGNSALCENYNNDFPCMQFVALTTSAAGGGGAGGGGAQGQGGAQQQAGGGGGAQSPAAGGKGAGGAGGGGGSVAQSPTQAVDCSRQSSASGPCAFTRNFMVDEPEWWDVSVGLATPGPKEAVFSPSTTGTAATGTPTCPKGYTCGFKHHADAYVLFDIYPLAQTWGRQSRPLFQKASFAPHFNFGIPITSQSLYRPYAGIAENISSPLEHHLGFPLSISFYGGVVWMKQSLCLSLCVSNFNGSTSSATVAAPVLPQDRAMKLTVGFEVSITGIASKLKGGGSSKSGGGSGGGSAGGGGSASGNGH